MLTRRASAPFLSTDEWFDYPLIGRERLDIAVADDPGSSVVVARIPGIHRQSTRNSLRADGELRPRSGFSQETATLRIKSGYALRPSSRAAEQPSSRSTATCNYNNEGRTTPYLPG
jgi:hypothetical protein